MKSIFTRISLLAFALGISSLSYGQCTNFSAFGTAVAPVGSTVTVTTCQYAGEYSTITGVAATSSYVSSQDLPGGYFTIRQGASNGPVVGFGPAPLSWTSTVAGTYYMHFNLDAACNTDFSCHTIYLNNSCATVPPSPVTASPLSICSGATSNLNATRAGCTIYWYTVPSGGVSIGTSASGANFPVTPSTSTTYYASAYNGSCYSNRTAVTVTVNPTPIITAVQSNPDTVCVGDPSSLTAWGCGLVSGFTSTYAPANWTTTHTPLTDVGTVSTAGAPASISITSSNGGNIGLHRVIYTVTVPCSGNITFNWDYSTTDVDGCHYDQPEYGINGVILGTIPGWVDYGTNLQSGSCVIPIVAGQTFSLTMSALDDVLGAATTVFTNFSGPGGSAGTMNWYTVPSGGALMGTTASGAPIAVSPAGPGTVTYYVQTTAGGCTSPRTPVNVVVESCVLPVEFASFEGEIVGNSNLLHWETANQLDIAYFGVERSTDGENFESVGNVPALDPLTGPLIYQFSDETPLPGANFYRLQAVDHNGQGHFSSTVMLNHQDVGGSITCYPNPAKETLHFQVGGMTTGTFDIIVVNVLGEVVISEEDRAIEPGETLSMDLRDLSPGYYMIRLKEVRSGTSRTVKFMHE